MVADLEEQKIRRARSGSALVHDRLKIKGMIPGVFFKSLVSQLYTFSVVYSREINLSYLHSPSTVVPWELN